MTRYKNENGSPGTKSLLLLLQGRQVAIVGLYIIYCTWQFTIAVVTFFIKQQQQKQRLTAISTNLTVCGWIAVGSESSDFRIVLCASKFLLRIIGI